MAEEKNLENRLKKWLHKIGVYPAGFPEDKMTGKAVGWYFKVWGGGYQKSGIPDMILNINGHFLEIELKAQDGRPSELQKLNTNRIRDSGGDACFLYPSGFERFQGDLMAGYWETTNGRAFKKLDDIYK